VVERWVASAREKERKESITSQETAWTMDTKMKDTSYIKWLALSSCRGKAKF
jgi:hypothetical protein